MTNQNIAVLPARTSTSTRKHGEFLRLFFCKPVCTYFRIHIHLHVHVHIDRPIGFAVYIGLCELEAHVTAIGMPAQQCLGLGFACANARAARAL